MDTTAQRESAARIIIHAILQVADCNLSMSRMTLALLKKIARIYRMSMAYWSCRVLLVTYKLGLE
jgi:hypothetical protein